MEHNVERLVVRSRDGDAGAFDVLVQLFQRRVFYTILKVVRDTHVADDLTQEVFITVYHKLEAIKDSTSFVSWVHRIAMNKAIDFKRRSKREQERVFLVEDFATVGTAGNDGPGTSSLEEQERKERAASLEKAMREAIDALPERQKKALLLSMDQKLSQDEIAEILEVPKGTIKSRLHHARKFLSAKLRHLLEGA